MSKFWDFRNSASKNEAELLFYGPIASEKPWWEGEDGDTITPKQFAKDLADLGKKDQITVRINSTGGDIWAANAIIAMLQANPARTIARIEGVAASAGATLAMGMDEVQLFGNSMMIIHDAMVWVCGYYNTIDLETSMQRLNAIKNSVVATIKAKTGKSEEEILNTMREEAWLTGQEAVDAGYADKVIEGKAVNSISDGFLIVNDVKHDLKEFHKIPNAIQALPKEPVANKSINQTKEEEQMDIKTVDELKSTYPELVNQLIDGEVKNAIEVERNRIKDIEAIANVINPDLVNKAKFEEPMNAEKLAFENAVIQAQQGMEYLNKVKEDAKNSGVGDVGSAPNEIDGEIKKQAQTKQKVNSIIEAANKLRGGKK